MKNFIDFVTDASNDKLLSNEFASIIEKGDIESVSKWFSDKGYSISSKECKKITAKDNLSARNLGLYPY